MGAWGHNPVESDNGQEFYAMALRKLPEQIVKGLRSKYMAEPLAAAFLLERVGFEGVYPGDLEVDLDLAITCLRALLADEDEAAEWEDPERWRSVVRCSLLVLEARRKDPRVPETQALGEKVAASIARDALEMQTKTTPRLRTVRKTSKRKVTKEARV